MFHKKNERTEALEKRIAELETALASTQERLLSAEMRLKAMEEEWPSVESFLHALEEAEMPTPTKEHFEPRYPFQFGGN